MKINKFHLLSRHLELVLLKELGNKIYSISNHNIKEPYCTAHLLYSTEYGTVLYSLLIICNLLFTSFHSAYSLFPLSQPSFFLPPPPPTHQLWHIFVQLSASFQNFIPRCRTNNTLRPNLSHYILSFINLPWLYSFFSVRFILTGNDFPLVLSLYHLSLSLFSYSSFCLLLYFFCLISFSTYYPPFSPPTLIFLPFTFSILSIYLLPSPSYIFYFSPSFLFFFSLPSLSLLPSFPCLLFLPSFSPLSVYLLPFLPSILISSLRLSLSSSLSSILFPSLHLSPSSSPFLSVHLRLSLLPFLSIPKLSLRSTIPFITFPSLCSFLLTYLTGSSSFFYRCPFPLARERISAVVRGGKSSIIKGGVTPATRKRGEGGGFPGSPPSSLYVPVQKWPHPPCIYFVNNLTPLRSSHPVPRA